VRASIFPSASVSGGQYAPSSGYIGRTERSPTRMQRCAAYALLLTQCWAETHAEHGRCMK